MNMQIVNDRVFMSVRNGSIALTNASIEQVMEMAEYTPVRWFQFWRKRQTVIVNHGSETITIKV